MLVVMGSPSSDPVEVTIYTTQVCPYCHAAKQLLRRRGISFKEVDVTGDESRRQWLREMTGRPTVPQIFFGSKAVGGFDDLAALDRSGSLATRLLEDTRDTSAALAPTTEANPS
jgi:glutaredoxin 3